MSPIDFSGFKPGGLLGPPIDKKPSSAPKTDFYTNYDANRNSSANKGIPADTLSPSTHVPHNPDPNDPDHIYYDAELGRFVQNGKTFTLAEIFFKIGSHAATVAKEMLATSVEHLDDSNKEGEAAVEWQNKIRSLQPNSNGTYSSTTFNQARQAFKNKYGYDPMDKYEVADLKKNNNTTYSKDELDKISNATKSFAGTVSSNQQAIQLDVSRYTHASNDADQLIASVDKSMSDTLTAFASKMT